MDQIRCPSRSISRTTEKPPAGGPFPKQNHRLVREHVIEHCDNKGSDEIGEKHAAKDGPDRDIDQWNMLWLDFFCGSFHISNGMLKANWRFSAHAAQYITVWACSQQQAS